jgi:LPXTG-motif cell wall-anchored protein
MFLDRRRYRPFAMVFASVVAGLFGVSAASAAEPATPSRTFGPQVAVPGVVFLSKPLAVSVEAPPIERVPAASGFPIPASGPVHIDAVFSVDPAEPGVASPAPVPTQPSLQPPSDANAPVTMAVAAGILLLALAGFLFANRRRNKGHGGP